MANFTFIGFLILCFSISSYAQNDVVDMTEQISVKTEVKEETRKQKKSPNQVIEKLEVTGSYIKRIDLEGPSPVVVIDREDFDKAGVDTVSDYMRESALFSGVQVNGTRDGFFYFRGQHAGSTLILINGMRVPKLGGGGSGFDNRGFYQGVSNIPTNIIERVEILKDGSSALYGSDAMAGVMNYITRKDFDGAEFSTRVNVPEINKGLQQNHNIAFGQSFAKGSWFASTQFVEQRGYTEADVGNRFLVASKPYVSESGITALNTVNSMKGKTQFIEPPCSRADGQRCQTDFTGVDFIAQPRTNVGTLLSGRYDVNSDISVSMVGIYNRRNRTLGGRPFDIRYGPRNGDPAIAFSQVQSNQLKTFGAQSGQDFFSYRYKPYTELGSREVEVIQDSYSAQAKVEGYYLDSWKWDLSGSYAFSNEERTHKRGLINEDIFTQQILNGSADPSQVGQNSAAVNASTVQGVEGYEASMTTARLLTTGELFDLNNVYGAGGPVALAIGFEGQWETTSDALDPSLFTQNLNQNFLSNIEGNRAVNSVFTEFVLYPLQSLEIQLAGRYDSYSDFGETFNPKISLGFRPSNKVLFRSSWGTNFNAPSIRNMIARAEQLQETYYICTPEEKAANGGSCRGLRVDSLRYRDQNLKEETGMNYNFGTVIQPNKAWTFTIDQWNFEGQDTIAKISGGRYSAIYDAIGEEGLEAAGVQITRDETTGEITQISAPQVANMGERLIRGLDINVKFYNPVKLFGRVFNFGTTFDHTHMLVHQTRRTPVTPVENRNDLEWKNTLSLSLGTQRHTYRVAARSLAGDTGEFTGTIRTHTEYDFNYNYKIPYWAGRFSFGVKNLLNTRPPVDRSRDFLDFTRGFNAYAFQALGRRYYVGYSHSF